MIPVNSFDVALQHRSNQEYEDLGFKRELRKRDLNRVLGIVKKDKELETKARKLVYNKLERQKKNLLSKVRKKESLLIKKKFK